MIRLPGFTDRVGSIEKESARLTEVVSGSLEAPVPSCPGWTGRELAEHVANVFTFFSHQLAAGDPEARHEPPGIEPQDALDPVGWLDAATAVLVESLSEAGPDEACWNWSGVDLDSGWVARRMALEIGVHRYDAELAAGEVTALDTALSVDGIDERLEVHLRTDVPENPGATLGGPLCLCCSDAEAAWVIEVGGGRFRCRRGAGPAAAVVRSTASQLFLFSWNRVGLDELELTGDAAVAARWSSLPV